MTIREVKPPRPFDVQCDDCKKTVRVHATAEENALPVGWRKHVEYVEGSHGRGYHTHKKDLCFDCKRKPQWAEKKEDV